MNINSINEAFSRIIKEEFDNQINNTAKDTPKDLTELNEKQKYIQKILDIINDELGIYEFEEESFGKYTFGQAGNSILGDIGSVLRSYRFRNTKYHTYVSPDSWVTIYLYREDGIGTILFEFNNQTDNNKIVIYKENGVYKTTSKANYDAQIQDARKIQTLYDFESAREIMDYYNDYFNTTDRDFIILDECTNSLKEAPEKKERAPRRPKKLFEDGLYDEVYARLSDAPIYDFQGQKSMWPFPKGQYDSEKELGVDWTDSDIVIKVITKVEDIKLDNARKIAKEYNLKTEYIGPNNTIGKSNEMLKIYIPMDAPSPFDEKRMKDWEEKTKAFKFDMNDNLNEGFETIKKAKEAIANDEELQAKLDSLGWLLSYINIDYDAIVKDFKKDNFEESASGSLNEDISDSNEQGLFDSSFLEELENWLKEFTNMNKDDEYLDVIKNNPDLFNCDERNLSNLIKEHNDVITWLTYAIKSLKGNKYYYHKWANAPFVYYTGGPRSPVSLVRKNVKAIFKEIPSYFYRLVDLLDRFHSKAYAPGGGPDGGYSKILNALIANERTEYKTSTFNKFYEWFKNNGLIIKQLYDFKYNQRDWNRFVVTHSTNTNIQLNKLKTFDTISDKFSKEFDGWSVYFGRVKTGSYKGSVGGTFAKDDEQYTNYTDTDYEVEDENKVNEDINWRTNPSNRKEVQEYVYNKIKPFDELTDDNSRYWDFDRAVDEGDDAVLVKAAPRGAHYLFSLLADGVDIDIYLSSTDVDTWYVVDNNPEIVESAADDGRTVTDLTDTLRALGNEASITADKLDSNSEQLTESNSIKESVSHSFNIGDTFKNVGKTFIVDDIKGDYTLVHSDELKFMPYIVAWMLSDDGSWGQGHYFTTREEAEEYLSKE